MARDWYELFKSWSKPPSETEEAKGSNAAKMINDALRSYPSLASKHFEVYATGSYRNNTNVRLGSDIDVAVVLTEAAFRAYPANGQPNGELLGVRSASYGLVEFRDDIGRALAEKFGSKGVTAADKTFNVHENSNRLDADVTAFCNHYRYSGRKNSDDSWHYFKGVETRSRKKPDLRIINWHQQHYDEGVKRNDATRRRFKRLTRILKKLREDMRDSGTREAKLAAEPVPSFLLECLVFNAPDTCFNCEEGSYYLDVRETLLALWRSTKEEKSCKDFLEVSRMKYLFSSTQPWSREHAHEFLLRAWYHVGFK